MRDLVCHKFIYEVNFVKVIGKITLNNNNHNENINNSIVCSIKSSLRELQTNKHGVNSLSKVSNNKQYAINVIIKACVQKCGIKNKKTVGSVLGVHNIIIIIIFINIYCNE